MLKPRIPSLGALALLVAGAAALPAQVIPPNAGAVYQRPADKAPAAAAVRPPSLAMSLPQPVAAALEPLTADDLAAVRARQGLEAIGVHRRLPQAVVGLSEEGDGGASVAGAWSDTASGPLWRLHLISRDAFAVRVHFGGFQVGQGRVWLHTGDGQVVGPYSGTGLFDNGDFWSDIVFGQAVTIEYQPAPGESTGLSVPFQLREISHIWRDPQTLSAGAPAPPWPAAALAAGPAVDAKLEAPQPIHAGLEPVEQEASCHLDVECSEDWKQTANGVGMILFEDDGSTAVCSGSLLNTRDNTFDPYFLTAAHCLTTESVARTLLSFWFFQSSSCNGPKPELRDVPRTTAGAHLLTTLGNFGDSKGDMTFLQILGDLPNGVFFQGWDPTRQPFGTQVVGIHHPRGTTKRISGGTIVPDTRFGTNSNVYALVNITAGRTEPGSSGSSLFSQPGVVVGELSFGLKTDDVCSVNPFPAGYTHFSVIYPEISRFLESSSGPPPQPVDPPLVLLSDQPQSFQFGPISSPIIFNGPDSWVLEVPENAVSVTLTVSSQDASVDVDLFARFDQDNGVNSSGGVVSDYASENESGNEQIVITRSSSPVLRAGRLFVSLALFNSGVVSRGTLTASIETAAPPPAPTGQTLRSGLPVDFLLPPRSGPTLFGGDSAYRIDVPAGATQLDVRINTVTTGVDVDLHLRRGAPPFVQDGEVVSDIESTSLSGDELVTLTPDNGLTPGTYFAALSLWTENALASGQIRADILTGSGPDQGPVQVLSSGQPGQFTLPAVDGPTFFSDTIFAVDVPQNASRLVVDLKTATQNVDVDLFVRLGQPPALSNGQVVANYFSEGLTGDEQIVIDGNSQPPLQAGRYFFGLVVYTENIASVGQVVATVDAGLPQVRLGAVANAASFEQGVISPGQIVSLFGSGMGPAQGLQPGLDGTGRLPTYAGGTIVLFGGLPAPLFFVRGDQINAQVPYGVAGRGTVDVVVITQGTATNVLQAQVRDAAPALFMFSDGSNRVIAVNSNGSINSPQNPARRGDYVTLYATGEGLTNPRVEEGRPAPSQDFALPVLPVQVRFGGVSAKPFFAGLAPGFAGLLQVNVFVPANAPTGSAVPVAISVGSFTGGTQPTIAIQ